jgi:Right handed beta helix region
MQNMTRFAVRVICTVMVGAGIAQATTVPSTITTTLTITTDSRLTSDVTCAVTGAPCIQFGAPGIKLNLNGHTMTGNGSRNTCTFSAGEDGIFTNGKNGAVIEGPGIVRRFNQRGIDVTGSYSIVEGVAVLSSCLEGILVGGSNNLIEDNSVARASLLLGAFDASIWVQGTGHHLILRNEVSAAGSFTALLGSPPYPAGGGQGIFVGNFAGPVPSTNNVIKGNNVSGIPGSGLFFTPGSTANVVSGNQFLGNLIFDDIFDLDNAVGQNLYFQNLCEVSRIGPGAINVCKIPDIAGHENPNQENEQ